MSLEGARYPPRKLEFGALVNVLVREHAVMKQGLQRAKEAAERRDFEAAGSALKGLEPVFRQHIADEESQVLGLLIDQLGVKGATEEIKVFQQHRPIYQLMRRLEELTAMPPSELEANQVKLDALFEEHTASEEARVFPRAMSFRRKNG